MDLARSLCASVYASAEIFLLLKILLPNYLPLPARRAGDYKRHSVRVCMSGGCMSVCVTFLKGLYITLVVSPWPFQCFMALLLMSFHLMLFFFRPRSIAK